MRTRHLTAAAALTTAALLTACTSLGTTTSGSGPVASTQPTLAATTAAATGAQAVKDWYTSGGQDLINTMSATMTKIGTDSSNVTALGADCQQLISDVTAAQAGTPIPDKQAQTSWASALDHLHQGSSDCAAGATAKDADQVSKGATEISEGTTDLTAVATRIGQLSGQ